ncbi:ABC transporter permease subunit [Eubacteriales bacterium OttesenSCG-928-A19]|nr:ABC transporter permease subunit [Eubacteriales bacterium OttesenSCG-928-A19]
MREKRKGQRIAGRQLRGDDWQLYTLMIPAAVLIIIFSYIPLYGIIIAFQDYQAGNSFLSLSNVNFVGLKHFRNYINSKFFSRTLINTIRLSLMNLLFGFTAPIIFALVLNEVRNAHFKKFVQTVSYLPYFISTVVVAGLVLSFLETNGMINNVLNAFGIARKEYIVYPEYYPWIYTITNVWKSFGFGSILYFSTISGIDPTLYESARIDGANRWKQMRHITLPSILYIIAVQLVLQMGHILDTNTDLALLLYRSATYTTSDVIGTYIYRVGIQGGKYSYTAAVGLFMSVIGFILTLITNRVSNRLTGYGLW